MTKGVLTGKRSYKIVGMKKMGRYKNVSISMGMLLFTGNKELHIAAIFF